MCDSDLQLRNNTKNCDLLLLRLLTIIIQVTLMQWRDLLHHLCVSGIYSHYVIATTVATCLYSVSLVMDNEMLMSPSGFHKALPAHLISRPSNVAEKWGEKSC